MTLHLFEGVGIELEYMIVDAASLDVRPIADQLLAEVGGGFEMEVELGDIAWSNELALHVIEMKTNGPAPALAGLANRFADHVRQIDELLAPRGARLLPTGMHPWMDPDRELRLWPHDDDIIYRTFDRIFDCRGHGWANLQSMHINLPFAGDDELARLHAAIRVVLPILPALAASSPYQDGGRGPAMDGRLVAYAGNARRVPSVAGRVIPERIDSRADYQRTILEPLYRDLAPLDPDGVLRHEWVNARGCIARFDRSALEIRILDTQEHPRADIAIAGAVIAVVRSLVDRPPAGLRDWSVPTLAGILDHVVADAGRAEIRNGDYLRLFGYPGREARAGALWQHLVDRVVSREPDAAAWAEPLEVILRRGCLARRIAGAAGPAPSRSRLAEVYRELADCLRSGRIFAG